MSDPERPCTTLSGHSARTDQRPQTAPNQTGYSHLLGSIRDAVLVSPH